MEQEEAYIQAVQSAVAYRVTDDRLELVDASGEATLVFARRQKAIRRLLLGGREMTMITLNVEAAISLGIGRDSQRRKGEAHRIDLGPKHRAFSQKTRDFPRPSGSVRPDQSPTGR